MSEAIKIDWAKWAAVLLALAAGVLHLHIQVAELSTEVKHSNETMRYASETLRSLVGEVAKNREQILVMNGNRYSSKDHKEFSIAVDSRMGRIEDRLLIVERRLQEANR